MLDELEGKHQARTLGVPEFRSHTGNPDRRAILASNHRMREGLDPGPRNVGPSDGFGRVALRIPEFDYKFIRAMFPDLASRDATTRSKGWKKFAASPLSEPYRVEEKRRRGGIVPVPAPIAGAVSKAVRQNGA